MKHSRRDSIIGPAIIGPAIIGPATIAPAAIDPAAIGPAAIGPVAMAPAVIDPAAIAPTAIDPTAVRRVAMRLMSVLALVVVFSFPASSAFADRGDWATDQANYGTRVDDGDQANHGHREDYGDLLFILSNDYEFTAGNCATMEMGSPWAVDENLAPLCADAVAREYLDLVYVVGRAGCDHIQVLDPQQGFGTLLQFSTGAGSNPQDICFVSPTRAFVTRYDHAELWEVDPSTGEHTDSIDLSPLADADGLPEMMGMAIAGDRLYVGVQRLDRDYYWTPVAPGYLAVIDLATNTLVDMEPGQQGVQGFALAATNPSMLFAEDPLTGRILIGETGSYGTLDGGIEIFDPATEQSLGFAITEAELGGELNQWTSVDMRLGFAITLSSSWATAVVAFDLHAGTNLGTVISSNEYAYTHLATDPSYGELYVADASYVESGVRVFDTATFEPLSGLIPVGLYPRALLPLHGPASGVEGHDPADPGDLAQDAFELTAWPQPALGPVRLKFRSPDRWAAGAQILDAAGREVFRWRGPFGPGPGHEFHWSGRDRASRPVASGTYFFRVYGEGQMASKRFQLLR